MKKKLEALLASLDLPYKTDGPTGVEISSLTTDSRDVKPGSLFVALKGEQTDGHRFVSSAAERGAAAILCSYKPDTLPAGLTCITSPEVNKCMAMLSMALYDTGTLHASVSGITGTNGKTTVTSMINHGLKSAGRKTVFIGTTGYEIAGRFEATDYTTPPAPTLHRLIRQGLDAGSTNIVMEVSSHALKLQRVYGMRFDVAVFTNLTHEHRELHPTTEDYFQTKASLFDLLKANGAGIVNTDDAYGKRLASDRGLLDFGKTARFARIIDCLSDPASLTQTIRAEIDQKPLTFQIPMIGVHNAYNAMAAMAALHQLGVDLKQAALAMKTLPPVPGRVDWVSYEKFDVVIDFAHTPDALEKVLESLRQICRGRLITVFGCPGSRDPSKRAPMGEIACRLSDFAVVTSDDVHYEDPQAIIEDIKKGINSNNYEVKIDRREAIAAALEKVQPGDLILLAGRGHERFQYVRDEKVPFEDKTVLREEAAKRGEVEK